MKSILRAAASFLLIAAIAACTLELPPQSVSASVERYEKGAPQKKWNLTEQEVKSLNEWFSQHKTGWSPSYVTYVPAVLVRVVHSGGAQSNINVWAGGFVVVNTSSGQFTQKFEEPDVRTLLAIVVQNGG